MLYLNPPYHIINGVCLFPDHIDPLQYYFLPLAPRLTQINDTTSGKRIPQIQLIKYRGKAGNGGFLNFDTNLGIEPEILEDIQRQLQDLQRLPQLPRLGPAPLVGGTVKMMLFGRQTGDVPAEKAQFVLKIDQHASPALYGDNQAAFSVSLDESGVILMEKALQGEMSPIGIVYSLDYLALRPAYSIRLNVDWDRVQKHLDEQFGFSSLIFSTQIEKAVDELIESRAITFDVDTFVPEDEENSAILTRRDQAVNEVRDMITDAFFTPSIDPMRPQEDGWDKAATFVERTSAIAATGGWGGVGAFNYKKTDHTRIDKKMLNVNITERTTVKRSIYPQGHLSGLCRVIEQQDLNLDDFIISVDLNDPWFEQRILKIISRANFEEDSISSINVRLQYGDTPRNVILESSESKIDLAWDSIVNNGEMEWDVTASYQVNFKNVDGTERPIKLLSPVQLIDTADGNLEINPRDLYSITTIPIVPLNFPWDRYPFVEVRVKYTDEENGIRIADTFMLNRDRPEQMWKMFVCDPQKNRFQYKLIFHGADSQAREMPWIETDEERISIKDPVPKNRKRNLTISAEFDWSQVSRAFIDVSYQDMDNDIYEEQFFEFTQANPDSKTFSVDLENPEHRLISYKATILYKGGRSSQIPRSFTGDRHISIRNDMKGHKIIALRSESVNFAAKQLKEIQVAIRYDDPNAGLSYADNFTFKSPADRATFEFDYVDEDLDTYEYQIIYRFTNGMSRTTDWQQDTAEELIVAIG